MGIRIYPAIVFIVVSALAGNNDPAWEPLDRAYGALRNRDYEEAIKAFRKAVSLAPSRADIRKDLAYTLLKIGESELARDEFGEAMRLEPDDDHVALEYAFLAYETKQQASARRIFDRIRRKGNATAEQAFQNIDRSLAEGIVRWTRAVELSPDNFSAHQELATLAEQRDQLELAADHYYRAWQLRPDQRAFLLHLGRVWQKQGKAEQAQAALLAASRGAESRVAEAARELLPDRYPWVYEFRAAIGIDPRNIPLRRELAWLHLEMGDKAAAENEFREVVNADSSDAWARAQLGFLLLARNQVTEAMPLLEQALESGDDELEDRVRSALQMPRALRKRPDVPRSQASSEALELAQRSLDAGYLKDAVKYLRIAHENDPLDFSVMLKLGHTWNVLKDDRQAVEWFRLARRSPDAGIAADASRAWKNLSPQFARIRTTAWMYPFYSSRWRDVFSYAQIRSELMPAWPVRPYISTRFAGDLRNTVEPGSSNVGPAYLSETAAIFAGGLTARPWRGIRPWIEAGFSVSYLKRIDGGRVRPDIRGGLSWSRSFGENFGPESNGLFGESTADFVYVSRFDHNVLLYWQNRGGYTLPAFGPAQVQFTWNANLNTDVRRFQWANSFETGPGARVRISAPAPMMLSIDALTGRHTVLDGTRPPVYSDLRIGLWYAFTR